MSGNESRAGGYLIAALFLAAGLSLLAFAAYSLGIVPRTLFEPGGEEGQGASALDAEMTARVDAELEKRYYAYSQLSPDDRRCYRVMLDAMTSRESRPYPESGADSLDLVRASVVADHPELFYVNGVRMATTYSPLTDRVTAVNVEGAYTYSEEETEQIQATIDDITRDFVASLPPEADDYAKAKAAYEYIVTNTAYDHSVVLEDDADGNRSSNVAGQTMADVFVDGLAVCAGYSAAFQHLMQASGVECTQVLGWADGTRHAWCLTKLDGAYYLTDPTWGDPEFLDEDESFASDFVNYAYLAATSEDMAGTHVPDEEYSVPVCVDDDDSYFTREGLLLHGADELALGSLVSWADGAGVSNLQVRCTDRPSFDALVQSVVESGRLGSYVSDGEYQYALFEDVYGITIFP